MRQINMTAHLCSFSHHLPERVVSNAELAARIGKPPEWIEKASGIRQRRWADPAITASDLGIAAATRCLENAGLAASSIGMLIVSSGSDAVGFPGPAAEIAHRLGLDSAPAIDLPIASAGSLFALAMAAQWTSVHEHILVVAAEKMSAIAAPEFDSSNADDPNAFDPGTLDPNTAILFGDGAGAVLVSRDRPANSSLPAWKLTDAVLHSDGQYRDALSYRPGSRLQMDGLTVIMQAIRKLPKVITELLNRNQVTPSDVGAFLVHQANLNLLQRVGKSLGVAEDKVFVNVDRYGNTSSASLLIAASEWASESALEPPNPAPIVLASFGAGFHWGALLMEPAT